MPKGTSGYFGTPSVHKVARRGCENECRFVFTKATAAQNAQILAQQTASFERPIGAGLPPQAKHPVDPPALVLGEGVELLGHELRVGAQQRFLVGFEVPRPIGAVTKRLRLGFGGSTRIFRLTEFGPWLGQGYQSLGGRVPEPRALGLNLGQPPFS